MIAIDPNLQATITSYVQRKRSRLIELTQGLVRLPSENKPPAGAESACQEYVARVLRASGWEPGALRTDRSERAGTTSAVPAWPRLQESSKPGRAPHRRRRRPLPGALRPHRYRSTRDAAVDARRLRRRGGWESNLRPRRERYESGRRDESLHCGSRSGSFASAYAAISSSRR